jgi:PPOX class probable F420-dependent enzyme
LNLDEETCWRLIGDRDHGVLATVHPARGVDAVPVVYVVLPGRQIVSPIDTVKPKRRARLRRLDNVRSDERCVLLVDNYEEDWTKLWWVRVHALARPMAPDPSILAALGDRFVEYQAGQSVSSVLVLTPVAVNGWASTPGALGAGRPGSE